MTVKTCLATLGLSANLATATTPADFINWDLDGNNDGQINSASNGDMNGSLYVPANYNPSKKYPIVMLLHGAGVSGFNNNHVNSSDLNNIYNRAVNREFFLFAPQAPTDTWKDSASYRNRATALLDRALATYNIDVNRQYIHGVSMGGGGVYAMVNDNATRYAAAVPVSGVGVNVSAANLEKTPMWIYHSIDDPTVGVGNSRNRVSDILGVKGQAAPSYPLATGSPYYTPQSNTKYFQSTDGELRYTEFLNYGHPYSWISAWNEEPMWNWMLAQSTVPEPASAMLIGAAGSVLCRRVRGGGNPHV